MQQFRCENCARPVYFDNDVCGTCGARLGFVPEESQLAAFRLTPEGVHLRYAVTDRYSRPCANYLSACRCNWMVDQADPNALCLSCRLTATIPDQTLPENQDAWLHLETAKRSWLYTILELNLPIKSRIDDPQQGLAFHFLRQIDAERPVLTGHDSGDITINAAESDPVARERSKHALHEPYRTLLGHFRHESGHYYWDRLIRDTAFIDAFRELFGDERTSYTAALERHYANGPPADWRAGFVSGYATMHPWEDWAETWAHYLHMVDLLGTARAWQLRIDGFSDQNVTAEIPTDVQLSGDFEHMLREWIPLTLLANSLNRSLGQADAYPFAPSYLALRKIHFVYDVLRPFRKTLAATAR